MEQISNELLINELPRKKNIGLKILFIILALMGVMLICLNFIPVNLKLDIYQNEVQSVAFYQDGGVSSQIWKSSNSEKFNEIMKKLNTTLRNDNLAYALFSGKINAKETISYSYRGNALSNIAMQSNKSTKYICLNFNEEKHILVNGKQYTSNELSSTSKKFVKALIEIKNNKTLTETTIYYINTNGHTSFRTTLYTSGSELFEYINNFF